MRSAVRAAIAFGLVSGLCAGAVGTEAQSSPDRIVGLDFFGKRLVIKKLTAADIGALAAAARTPMGFEAALDGGPVRLDKATLIDAINYQQSLLEPGLRYGREPDRGDDVPRITLALPNATHLTLANAIAKSHGDVCWIYEELDDRQTAFFGGRRHQLSFRARGGSGRGFAFR